MKIALKPFLNIDIAATWCDWLMPSIKQLTVLAMFLFALAVSKIYQSYDYQQHVAWHVQTQQAIHAAHAYHKALRLEQSTLLQRSQVIADAKRYLHMRVPVRKIQLHQERH